MLGVEKILRCSVFGVVFSVSCIVVSSFRFMSLK